MDPCGSIDAFKHFTSPFYKSCCANGSWHWALRDFPSSTHRCFLRHSSSHQLLCQELWTCTVITWLGTKTSLHPMKSPQRWKYTFNNMNKLEKGTKKIKQTTNCIKLQHVLCNAKQQIETQVLHRSVFLSLHPNHRFFKKIVKKIRWLRWLRCINATIGCRHWFHKWCHQQKPKETSA